jgi:hypothetical protein
LLDTQSEREGLFFDGWSSHLEPATCRPIWLADDKRNLGDRRESFERRNGDGRSAEKNGAHEQGCSRSLHGDEPIAATLQDVLQEEDDEASSKPLPSILLSSP